MNTGTRLSNASAMLSNVCFLVFAFCYIGSCQSNVERPAAKTPNEITDTTLLKLRYVPMEVDTPHMGLPISSSPTTFTFQLPDSGTVVEYYSDGSTEKQTANNMAEILAIIERRAIEGRISKAVIRVPSAQRMNINPRELIDSVKAKGVNDVVIQLVGSTATHKKQLDSGVPNKEPY